MSNARSMEQVSRIIEREGGYVNRAEDRGGPTNFGITLTTLSEERGRAVTAQEVKELTRAEAENIYLRRYIAPFEGIEWTPLFDLVVDSAVNNGRGRASKWLQRALDVVEDGVVGPITLARANEKSASTFLHVVAIRMKAYGALISQQHSQAVFAAGWMNRLAQFVTDYAEMVETEQV